MNGILKPVIRCCLICGFCASVFQVAYAAVINPKPLGKGRKIVEDNVARILRSDPGFFRGLRVEELTIAAPHQGYGVGLDDLASGQLLSATKVYCWRYLLMHGTNAVGVAELNADKKSGKARGFNSLQKPFFPDAPLEAVRRAEQLQQTKKQDYELRYLSIPGAHFMAVWLHGKADDIIIPLPPTFERFEAYQPYTESEIFKVLKPSVETAKKWGDEIRKKAEGEKKKNRK